MKSFALVILLAACGDDGGTNPPVDAPASIDAPAAATVMEVSCTGITPAATVMTSDATFSYSPAATTISSGGVVKFVTSTTHDVKPNPIAAKTDVGLNVGFNQTKCLKFTATGAFGFVCSVHSFAGTVTVN